jgi:hypothetical protein
MSDVLMLAVFASLALLLLAFLANAIAFHVRNA